MRNEWIKEIETITQAPNNKKLKFVLNSIIFNTLDGPRAAIQNDRWLIQKQVSEFLNSEISRIKNSVCDLILTNLLFNTDDHATHAVIPRLMPNHHQLKNLARDLEMF